MLRNFARAMEQGIKEQKTRILGNKDYILVITNNNL
jgi:hypothetical protein